MLVMVSGQAHVLRWNHVVDPNSRVRQSAEPHASGAVLAKRPPNNASIKGIDINASITEIYHNT